MFYKFTNKKDNKSYIINDVNTCNNIVRNIIINNLPKQDLIVNGEVVLTYIDSDFEFTEVDTTGWSFRKYIKQIIKIVMTEVNITEPLSTDGLGYWSHKHTKLANEISNRILNKLGYSCSNYGDLYRFLDGNLGLYNQKHYGSSSLLRVGKHIVKNDKERIGLTELYNFSARDIRLHTVRPSDDTISRFKETIYSKDALLKDLNGELQTIQDDIEKVKFDIQSLKLYCQN